jgi:sensor histidine kinase YesM
MMKNEKRTASDYLGKFALLIRLILDSSSIDLLPLSRDTQALNLYVELEQLRFDHAFCYEINIDPELSQKDILVPGLLIQPYLENAILHGLSHSEKDKLRLQLTIGWQDGFIVYTVEDNGIGRKKSAEYNQQNKRTHKSRGMAITRERINILNQQFQADGKISVTDLETADGRPAGTKVEVMFKGVNDAGT